LLKATKILQVIDLNTKNRYFVIWKVKKMQLNSAKRKKFEVIIIFVGEKGKRKIQVTCHS
jgi:hypothetical protein